MEILKITTSISSPLNWFCKKPTAEEIFWREKLLNEEVMARQCKEKLIPSKPSEALTLDEVKQLVTKYQVRHNRNTLKSLALIISGIALAMLASPLFCWGISMGISNLYYASILIYAYTHIFHLKRAKPTNEKELGPHYVSWIGPCLEELFFRVGVQGAIKTGIEHTLSKGTSIALSLMGMQFTIAQTVAILATSALFGYGHTFNHNRFESKIHLQSIVTTISGIELGILKEQFGLTASIAAHIGINTPVTLLSALVTASDLRKQKRACAATNTTTPKKNLATPQRA